MSINIVMTILSLDKLKLIAKDTGVKDYKNKSEDDLIKIPSESKTKDVNKSRHMFSRSKIKQIRKNLHDVKNQKSLSKS